MCSSKIFFLFLHHLTSETNNKALVQRTSQYFDMIHVIAALSYFPVTLSWNKNTHRSYSELLPSYSELKHDTHRSYSELLPSCSELKHDTHCSYSELLPSCSELKRDTHCSYSELLPSCSEVKHDTHRGCSELLPSYSELKYNAHRSCSKPLPRAASYITRNSFSELVSFSSELKTLDWLMWDIQYKFSTNNISSNSQKFS